MALPYFFQPDGRADPRDVSGQPRAKRPRIHQDPGRTTKIRDEVVYSQYGVTTDTQVNFRSSGVSSTGLNTRNTFPNHLPAWSDSAVYHAPTNLKPSPYLSSIGDAPSVELHTGSLLTTQRRTVVLGPEQSIVPGSLPPQREEQLSSTSLVCFGMGGYYALGLLQAH